MGLEILQVSWRYVFLFPDTCDNVASAPKKPQGRKPENLGQVCADVPTCSFQELGFLGKNVLDRWTN